MREFRQQFPFFNTQIPTIYFDNAATTQKPQCVIDAITHANIQQSANVHRSSYQLAASVTDAYESARNDVAQLINAATAKQIFWSKGATESLNLIAHGLGELCLTEHSLWQGDEIIILTSEHHANILPWQQLVNRIKPFKLLRVTPVSPDINGNYDYAKLRAAITNNTAVVAVAHVSNALGCVHPVAQISQWAHQHHALCIVDGTQALAHIPVDVQALNCDAYVGSSHKMFGPTGVGFGYATHALLGALPPYQVGGEMIEYVSFDEVRYQSYPLKFEAGTPNISGVIGLGTAAKFVLQHQANMLKSEHLLMQYLLSQLAELNTELDENSHSKQDSAKSSINIIGADNAERISLCSFVLNGISHYDVLRLLDNENIALRVGHHCAMPLMQHLGIDGTMRVSLCAYNTQTEIDMFIIALRTAIKRLGSSDDVMSEHSESDTSSVMISTSTPIGGQFTGLQGYDVIFRQIMLSSKACPLLSEQYHIADYHVAGCEVDVWIGEFAGQFSGFATSKIIKGLLAILLEKANTLSPTQRATFDFTEYLAQLGVSHHLSQSRVDGLSRVIARLSA
jgi:cysteine desulfurase/selenocysteine lyase